MHSNISLGRGEVAVGANLSCAAVSIGLFRLLFWLLNLAAVGVSLRLEIKLNLRALPERRDCRVVAGQGRKNTAQHDIT